jgi:hypothetical protein
MWRRNRHFGGTYRFHHQGDNNQRTRKFSSNQILKSAAKKYWNFHPGFGRDEFLLDVSSYKSHTASQLHKLNHSQNALIFFQCQVFPLSIPGVRYMSQDLLLVCVKLGGICARSEDLPVVAVGYSIQNMAPQIWLIFTISDERNSEEWCLLGCYAVWLL